MGTTEAGASSGIKIITGMLSDGGGANGLSSIGDMASDVGWREDAFGGCVGGEGDEYVAPQLGCSSASARSSDT